MDDFKLNLNDPSKNILTTFIHRRIAKNKNFLCAITGPTGSGKTYSALSLAKQWDADFSAKNIVFTPKEFIALLNEGDLKSGSVILFEEAGVTLNSRNWQSQSNNLIQYILQTFRHKNYIVIFTAPDFGFIDGASRKLFHAHFMTVGINFSKKRCRLKPYFLQINQRSGDIYYKFLRAVLKGHGEKKIQHVNVGLPDKTFLKEYETMKSKFTNELNKDVADKLNDTKENKNFTQLKLEKKDKQLHHTITNLRNDKKKWDEIAKFMGFDTLDSCKSWYRDYKKRVGEE